MEGFTMISVLQKYSLTFLHGEFSIVLRRKTTETGGDFWH